MLEQPTDDTDGWGAIEISVGKKTDRYLVQFIPSDFGDGAAGFEVEKLDAELTAKVETYHVHLADKVEECSCTSKGCTQHGHCKHADGLRVVAGRLWPRLYTARDARRDPEPHEQPQLDEAAYFDPQTDL